MNITQESVDTFAVGHGGADAMARQVVESGRVSKAYKGLHVRAATANTVVIYIGKRNVTVANGYPLPAGEEIVIPVEDPSKVYVTATPASNCQQTVTLSGQTSGDTFTLTYAGRTTTPIPVTADAGTVQAALEALATIGTGNVTVGGTAGAYTVTFVGALAKTNVDLLTSVGAGVNEKQKIDVSDAVAGDKVLVSYDGTPATGWVLIDNEATAIQAHLETIPALAGNVSVTGNPEDGFEVEFIGALGLSDIPNDKITALCGKNEKQRVTITNAVVGDTLKLYGGEGDTGELAYNVSGEALETALFGFGSGAISVTGDGPYVLEWTGQVRTHMPDVTGYCGQNEKQTITVSGTAGDTMLLTFGAETIATPLAYNVSGADLQTALRALSTIGDGNVTVTGDGPYLVEFVGSKVRHDYDSITGTCGTNEEQSITRSDADTGTFSLSYGGQTTSPEVAWNETTGNLQAKLEGLSSIGPGNVEVGGTAGAWTIKFKGVLGNQHIDDRVAVSHCGKNEKQTVTLTNVTGGNFTLSYDGTPTANILYTDLAATVQTRLEAIAALTGKVTVTGATPEWTVEFTGGLGLGNGALLLVAADVDLTGDGHAVNVAQTLDGTTATVTVLETTAGHHGTVIVEETQKGHAATLEIVETAEGHDAAVGVAETQKGDASCTVTIAKVADITLGSQYSWLAC